MFATTNRRFLSPLPPNGLHHPTRTLITTANSSIAPLTRRYSSSSSSKPSRNGSFIGRASSPFRRKVKQVEAAAAPVPPSAVADATAKPRIEPVIQPESPALPFVPGTGHLYQSDVAISSFFALHRPVSILFPVPGEYSASTFSTIFDEVTPTSAIEKHQRQYEVQARAAGTQTESIDGENTLSYATTAAEKKSPSSAFIKAVRDSPLQLPHHILVSKFQPFQPPPPPKVMPKWDLTKNGDAFSLSEKMSDKLRGETTKILDVLRRQGLRVHSTEIVSVDNGESSDRPEPGFPRLRRTQIRDETSKGTMWTLSVKRQRRLKMKKHKYKKLMKKTRSERRKLEKH